MNTRVILHIVDVIALLVLGGTVKFAGVPSDIMVNVLAVLALVSAGIEAYLGTTTTGLTDRPRFTLKR